MNWDYAELSKKAKEAGGPGELLAIVENHGRKLGRQDAAPWIVVAFGAGCLITVAGCKVWEWARNRRVESETKASAAKEAFIQHVEEWDSRADQNRSVPQGGPLMTNGASES